MARYVRSWTHATLVSVCVLFLLPTLAAAQTPTGTISGRITDSNGGAIRGAIITIDSPNMPGTQVATTTVNGDYIFRLLPPGPYTLTVSASGFAGRTTTVTLSATEPVKVDMTIVPAGVSEQVQVEAEAAPFVRTIQAATNFTAPLLRELPTARTILSAVDLTPSVHATGPGGARSIGGAMSFESQYMVNGVQIQDNLRGTPFNLFIEDAIQETTTMTSGMSAEFGRLTGGAINTITKSGGNQFSGSYRTTFNNDDWRTVSPFGEPKTDSLVPTHEITIGGPIVADRTWFFGAARFVDQTTARETAFTGIPFNFNQDEKRFEIKGTQAIGSEHRLQVGYIGIREERMNDAFPSLSEIMDLASLKNRKLPQNLFSAHYTGQLGSMMFLEGQYSLRTFTFVGDGGLSTDLIAGTTLVDQQNGTYYWSPAFCGVCKDEERDNTSFLVKGSYFLSTRSGAHNMVFGYDTINDKRNAENHQSGSDYHIWSTTTRVVGDAVFPVFDTGESTYIIYWPITEAGRSTNFRSHALFFNDSWTLNPHWSFNLGLRYDKNDGKDASGNAVARDSAFSPRLGVSFDPRGDGRTTIHASYGRYVAAIANSIANSQSPAGTPSILAYYYQGDPINDDPGVAPVPTDVAVRQVFDWYFADGGTTLFFADIPGVATRIPRSLKSPHADEIAFGLSQQVGTNGVVRLEYIDRKFGDFYAERIDTTTGTATDEFGQVFDMTLVENTNLVKRHYRAFTAQGNYRPGSGLYLGLSYTLSRLWGNINGENISSGPLPNDVLTYPEYFDRAWSFPEGDLESDQRHRLRIWGTYALPFIGGRHTVSVGVIQQAQSGVPYGAGGTINTVPFVPDFGYNTPPSSQIVYWFTPRDEFRTEAMYRTDLSVNYGFSVTATAEFFAQAQILNLFNQFQAFDLSRNAINTTVLTAVDDRNRFAVFNPFTETPVRGVHWEVGDEFGKPTAKEAYTLPRTFLFSAGFRF